MTEFMSNVIIDPVRACLQGERVTLAKGYPGKRVTLALTHFLLFSSLCLQGSYGYRGRWVTLCAC